MKNKIVTVTSLDLVPKLKEMGIEYLAYPLFNFCVGIPNTFKISEITSSNAYLFVNRVLDSKSCDELNDLLHSLPSNIKGIIFDDLGIIQMTIDLDLTKILYYSHFNTNYISINHFFDYADEIIVSTDITKEEILQINKLCKKPISIFSFGLVPAMYSRRKLLTNYNKHYNLPNNNTMILKEEKEFLAFENEFGTVLYYALYYNASSINSENFKFLFYFPIFLNDSDVLKVVTDDFSSVASNNGFLDTKTIYKVK